MQIKISFPGDGVQTPLWDASEFLKEKPSDNNEEIYRQASEQPDCNKEPYEPFIYWR